MRAKSEDWSSAQCQPTWNLHEASHNCLLHGELGSIHVQDFPHQLACQDKAFRAVQCHAVLCNACSAWGSWVRGKGRVIVLRCLVGQTSVKLMF